MSPHRVLDVSRLETVAFTYRAPLFWGALGIAAIEGAMFGLLIASYFYLRLGVDVWPPPGVQYPNLTLPTIELLLLLVSCIPAYLATEAAKRNDIPRILLHLAVNLALATLAFVLRIMAWNSFNFNWRSDVHGSIVWSMLGLHTFDLGAGMLVTAVLLAIGLVGQFSDTQRKGTDFDSVTWYFVVSAWIPLYAVIYIAPHVVRSP